MRTHPNLESDSVLESIGVVPGQISSAQTRFVIDWLQRHFSSDLVLRPGVFTHELSQEPNYTKRFIVRTISQQASFCRAVYERTDHAPGINICYNDGLSDCFKCVKEKDDKHTHEAVSVSAALTKTRTAVFE